eukprot:1405985-Alexandrium_andersonii.AAC.1
MEEGPVREQQDGLDGSRKSPSESGSIQHESGYLKRGPSNGLGTPDGDLLGVFGNAEPDQDLTERFRGTQKVSRCLSKDLNCTSHWMRSQAQPTAAATCVWSRGAPRTHTEQEHAE